MEVNSQTHPPALTPPALTPPALTTPAEVHVVLTNCQNMVDAELSRCKGHSNNLAGLIVANAATTGVVADPSIVKAAYKEVVAATAAGNAATTALQIAAGVAGTQSVVPAGTSAVAVPAASTISATSTIPATPGYKYIKYKQKYLNSL